jgi:hypothetical protein
MSEHVHIDMSPCIKFWYFWHIDIMVFVNTSLSPTVALNYQTEGKFMDFNDGRFRANGRSGYILKPDYMRQGALHVDLFV